MLSFNKILRYDPNKRLVTVEPGITWAMLQNKINKDNLAIRVMQSSNIFTVGGSISVNAHGRDPNQGTMISGFNVMDIPGWGSIFL